MSTMIRLLVVILAPTGFCKHYLLGIGGLGWGGLCGSTLPLVSHVKQVKYLLKGQVGSYNPCRCLVLAGSRYQWI